MKHRKIPFAHSVGIAPPETNADRLHRIIAALASVEGERAEYQSFGSQDERQRANDDAARLRLIEAAAAYFGLDLRREDIAERLRRLETLTEALSRPTLATGSGGAGGAP